MSNEEIRKNYSPFVSWILGGACMLLLGLVCFFLSAIYSDFKEMNRTLDKAVNRQGVILERMNTQDDRIYENKKDIKAIEEDLWYNSE